MFFIQRFILFRKLKKIFAIFPQIKLAYFFGSRATGEAGPLSDYDFAFYLDEKDSLKRFDLRLKLMDKIGALLKTDAVDVVIINDVESLDLKYNIIQDGILLYSQEPYQILVEPRILNEYFDFNIFLRRHHLTKA